MKRFGVILLLLLLVASAAVSEQALPAELSEGSRLIGLLITTEPLSACTGESGQLPASLQTEPESDPEVVFGEVRGLRLLCFPFPDKSGDNSRIVSNVDNGFTAVDFEIEDEGRTIQINAVMSVVPGPEEMRFFCNPVMMALSGQVYALPGDFMAVNADMNPPGSSVGQTIRDERKGMEHGREITDVMTVTVQIDAVREPVEIRLLQFSDTHELLKSETFLPGTVPDQIVPLTEAAYLLLETVEKDGETKSVIQRTVTGRDEELLSTLSCGKDNLCISHAHEVLWQEKSEP